MAARSGRFWSSAVTPATKLIVLTNLHNPSGNRTDIATLRDIAALAARVGARMMIDEIFLDSAETALDSAVRLSDLFVCTGSLT